MRLFKRFWLYFVLGLAIGSALSVISLYYEVLHPTPQEVYYTCSEETAYL